jgi:hypothetical protein
MGGPRLCLGGRSPITQVLRESTVHSVGESDEAFVASFLSFYTRCVYSSYGGPQALPGGAKPDISGRNSVGPSLACVGLKKPHPYYNFALSF